MTLISFNGFIRDIIYTPYLTPKLKTYDINNFNINSANTFGKISLDSADNYIAFSKWVSPKRTRSYPFARIYNTYHLNSKSVTVIPIMKDEGMDGDNDRINFITLSWMNLLNVYIVLAWYEQAEVVPNKNKITTQKFNSDHVKQKILEISNYHSTALHWNTTHFEKDFQTVFLNAVNSYEQIATTKNVQLRSREKHLQVLQQFQKNDVFYLDKFRDYTLKKSQKAAHRESVTTHQLEHLTDGDKGIFYISNYLGGIYHLTADEVYKQNNVLVIQESKNNSKGKLPSKNDIKDGLFKLILFSNLDCLYSNKLGYLPFNNVTIRFWTLLIDMNPLVGILFLHKFLEFKICLKITGELQGNLDLPNSDNNVLNTFCQNNGFSKTQRKLIELLNQEATNNHKLNIIITKNG
ncbi:MAG: hypothetical protein QNJ47_24375 [Nostocaceae cyanobacterium]|nr:hypothetical protein [Nostocaceae cyanobacterium]